MYNYNRNDKNTYKKSTETRIQTVYKRASWVLFCLFLSTMGNLATLGNSVGEVYQGNASWYGEPFHGRKTASGEIYDMNLYTAAHRTLPFGTYLRVTNLKNNLSIVVKVNDRGPFVKNRMLDLSRKSAQKLNFIHEGVIPARIEILGTQPPQSSYANQPSSRKNLEPSNLNYNENPNYNGNNNFPSTFADPPKKNNNSENPIQANQVYVLEVHRVIKKTDNPQFKIQLGAYTSIEPAIQQRKYYDQEGIESYLCTFAGSSNIFRILSKKSFRTLPEAVTYRDNLRNQGIQSFVLEF